MSAQTKDILRSIEILAENLDEIARVEEWADKMGYQSTKKFSRCFLRYYAVRPCKILAMTRLKSIYKALQADEKSNFAIARRHSMPDEKALNMFVNYHLDCPPSQLQLMDEMILESELEKLCSEIQE